jgi:hypothetical protein
MKFKKNMAREYKPKDIFSGEKNVWKLRNGQHLQLVSYYPTFFSDLKSALNELVSCDRKATTICHKIETETHERILKQHTYRQFSKWCDWSVKKEEALAKNISRILFGFDMPRMIDQQNKVIDENIIENFLDKVTEGKKHVEDAVDNSDQDEAAVKQKYGFDLNEISREFDEYRKEGRIEFITFHPSYSYEEFIEGITVEIEEENKASEEVKYILKPGIFKGLCKRALGTAIGLEPDEFEKKSWGEVFEEYCDLKDQVDFENSSRFVLIIDEINRGDIAKIFGELITLLEADKRLGAENELITRLPASGDHFGVPGNLFIVATMNTADRSIALLDVALRRRFGFIEMNPNFDVLDAEHLNKNKDDLIKNDVYELLIRSKDAILKINKEICDDTSIGRDKQIGHSFLFKVKTPADLCLVWKHEILPLLEEYCYSDYVKINRMLFGKESDTEWISESEGIKDINIKTLDTFLDQILANT